MREEKKVGPIGVIIPGRAFVALDPEDTKENVEIFRSLRSNASGFSGSPNQIVGTNGMYNRHAKHKYDIAKGFEVGGVSTRRFIVVG